MGARRAVRQACAAPADAVAAGALALPQDDPFDRMLIVQSRRLGARIVTTDDAIRRHAGCVW
jgi:PIN domain nuclease of toxin-antitoxin system